MPSQYRARHAQSPTLPTHRTEVTLLTRCTKTRSGVDFFLVDDDDDKIIYSPPENNFLHWQHILYMPFIVPPGVSYLVTVCFVHYNVLYVVFHSVAGIHCVCVPRSPSEWQDYGSYCFRECWDWEYRVHPCSPRSPAWGNLVVRAESVHSPSISRPPSAWRGYGSRGGDNTESVHSPPPKTTFSVTRLQKPLARWTPKPPLPPETKKEPCTPKSQTPRQHF